MVPFSLNSYLMLASFVRFMTSWTCVHVYKWHSSAAFLCHSQFKMVLCHGEAVSELYSENMKFVHIWVHYRITMFCTYNAFQFTFGMHEL